MTQALDQSDTDHQAVAISVNNASLTWNTSNHSVQAMRDISVDIPSSRWTSIMGPSGSGKTTFLHCLAGLLVPDSGKILLTGQKGSTNSAPGVNRIPVNLAKMSEDKRAKIRRSRIGVIFQDFNLVPVLTAEDNIKLPLRLSRSKVNNDWFTELVTLLGIESTLKQLPSQLSGGQRQRVAIARALMHRPDVILADEPTGSLDSHSSQQVLQLFRAIVDRYGQTIVMVTHDKEAAECSDRIVCYRDGQVVSE